MLIPSPLPPKTVVSIADSWTSDRLVPLLQSADSFYASGKFALAKKGFAEAVRHTGCKGAVGDSSDRDGILAYALARLFGVAAHTSREGLRGLIGACRLDKSWSGPYDKALAKMRAHRYREAFTEFSVGYALIRQTKIVHVVGGTAPYDEISRVFVGLQTASNGDYVRARSLLRSALRKAEAGEISPPLFFLAQLDLVASDTRSAEKGLADAIVPHQAFTSFPALDVASWAAAYQLQGMIVPSKIVPI